MPRHILTPEQIAAIPARHAAGERVAALAREYGVDPSTISYHLRGGKVAQYIGSPWRPHCIAAGKAIRAGNHAEAAYCFKQAAEVLIKL